MKIDFSQKLTNLDGSISDEAPTLGQVAVKALVEAIEDDRKESGEPKFARAVTAQKIYSAGLAEISVEEVATIKTRIGKLYPPVVVYAAWNALEGDR